MKNAIYALIPLLFFVGCGDGTSGVKDAKGETPVKYVICGPGERNCFVAARFSDIEGCENHKNWSVMLCDSKSKPGTMVCTTDTEQIAATYCTL
jgi:hypothetical protein